VYKHTDSSSVISLEKFMFARNALLSAITAISILSLSGLNIAHAQGNSQNAMGNPQLNELEANHDADIAALQAELDAANVQVATLQAQVDALNAFDIAALQAQVDAMDAYNLALGTYVVVDDTTDPSRPVVQVVGANLQVINGLGAGSTGANGVGNLLVGYDEERHTGDSDCSWPQYTSELSCLSAGKVWARNHKSGSHYLVIGKKHNYSRDGGLVAGHLNTVNGIKASISGGFNNTASGTDSSVSGGSNNTASGHRSSVSGGYGNTASEEGSSVSGGRLNTAAEFQSSVSGGVTNTASGSYSSVSGGSNNTASGTGSSVSGGSNNTASTDNSHLP
jgi:hypothetical protein